MKISLENLREALSCTLVLNQYFYLSIHRLGHHYGICPLGRHYDVFSKKSTFWKVFWTVINLLSKCQYEYIMQNLKFSPKFVFLQILKLSIWLPLRLSPIWLSLRTLKIYTFHNVSHMKISSHVPIYWNLNEMLLLRILL